MIIYEVNLKVQISIIDKYKVWLEKHIGQMLEIHGFERAETYLVESDEIDTEEICVQYTVKSRGDLENYLEKYAENMRADGLARFGDQFKATRRILSN